MTILPTVVRNDVYGTCPAQGLAQCVKHPCKVPVASSLLCILTLLALDVGKSISFTFVSLALNMGLYIKCSIDAKFEDENFKCFPNVRLFQNQPPEQAALPRPCGQD